MKKLITILFACLLCYNKADAQMVPEQAVPNLPDIAIAALTPQGFPIVYFNPNVCAQVGQKATLFFKMHEQGHHARGHVLAGNSNNPYVQYWLSRNAENDADLFAANYWMNNNFPPYSGADIIRGWCRRMWDDNLPGDKTHMPSRMRANNVANYVSNATGQQFTF